jgi:two-component system KDP operon response regulator KdpE
MTEEKIADKQNVLLVDDDKFLLDMYAMKFTQAGYNVHASLSVKNALETLRGGFNANAIVFDLVMPQDDGFFLLDTIRKEKLAEHAALIALSNQSDEAEKKKATELGANAYIIKASMIPSEVVDAIGSEIKKNKK